MTQLTSRFNEALVYACNLHREQIRKADGTPYVAHLLAVAALVLEDGGSETEAIAALLHDAIEDQGGAATRRVILEKFGSDVTAIVEGCTESMTLPKPPWRERKTHYLANLQQATPSILRVSLADKLHNGRSLLKQIHAQGPAVWQHFHQPASDVRWFYEELLQVYTQRSESSMIHSFQVVVHELQLEVPASSRPYDRS